MKERLLSASFLHEAPIPKLILSRKGGHVKFSAKAPAKLNLFLHITGRREDGYHLLQSVFQFIDWADELHFELREDGEVLLTTEFAEVCHEDNLIIRAARLLQQASGHKSLGCNIAIEKLLPMGGGLGGGSSDAATTLVCLNHLWDLGLSRETLIELGAKLGADVPVFIFGHACWAEGIGDDMVAVEPEEPWFFVIRPDVHVETGSVFSDLTLTRNCSPIKIADFVEGGGVNVCEEVVLKRYSEVAEALDWIESQSELSFSAGTQLSAGKLTAGKLTPGSRATKRARMTGTGSCVFYACENRQQALQLQSRLPSHMNGFVAKGANTSLLFR